MLPLVRPVMLRVFLIDKIISSSPVQLLGLRIAQRNRSPSFIASSQLYKGKDQCFQRSKFQQAKKEVN